MIIFTKTSVQLTPRAPPLHSMLCHFCTVSHWVEPGLGRGLTGALLGLWGLKIPSHWQRLCYEQQKPPGFPDSAVKCSRVWTMARLLNKQGELGSCSKTQTHTPQTLKLCIVILEQKLTSRIAVLSVRDLPQRLLKSLVVQEIRWCLEAQLMQKSCLYYKYSNDDWASGVIAKWGFLGLSRTTNHYRKKSHLTSCMQTVA